MGVLLESTWMELVSIFVSLSCMVFAYFHYMFGYWTRRGVPSMSPQFPFGNAKRILLETQAWGEFFNDIYKYFKERGHAYGGFYILSSPQLLIVDPELAKDIMSRSFSHFSNRIMRSNDKLEPLTCTLPTLTGNEWKSMRQKITPTFTSSKMKFMFDTMLACCDGLETILGEYIDKKEDIDVKDILGRFATDIIGSCAFGLECNSMKDNNSEFRQFGRKVFTPTPFRSFKDIVWRTFPSLMSLLGIRQIDKDVSDFFMKVVTDTIKYREENHVQRNDFLQLLINIRNMGDVDAKQMNGHAVPGKEKQGLTLGEIAANSFLFFIAGFEPTSTAMALFLYDVAKHQDVQDKVRKEIRDMLARHNGKLTYDGIMELQYLEMVLWESIRLHSTFSMVQRLCTKEYQLPNGTKLTPGDIVTIPIIGMQHDPDYYPNPELFDPERFNAEQRKQRNPYTFLPFGAGPRVCIGQKFALLQTKVGVITLLKNHRITVCSKTLEPLMMDPKSLVFTVVGGIWINAERI